MRRSAAFAARRSNRSGGVLAPESYNPAQIYYLGKVRGATYETHHVAGLPLDRSELALVADVEAMLKPRGVARDHAARDNRLAVPLQGGAGWGDADADDALLDALESALAALPRPFADDRKKWVDVAHAVKSADDTC